jgi:hypothetical protein
MEHAIGYTKSGICGQIPAFDADGFSGTTRPVRLPGGTMGVTIFSFLITILHIKLRW